MKYIYHCFGGSHSSVTASAIHMGNLPENRVAAAVELLSIPYYDSQISLDHGRLRFIGWDNQGCEIFIASKRGLGKDYEKILRTILDQSEISKIAEELVFIDTMPAVNIFMMIGGYLSRRLGWTRFGRAVVVYGTRQSYTRFVQLVRQVREKNSNPVEDMC